MSLEPAVSPPPASRRENEQQKPLPQDALRKERVRQLRGLILLALAALLFAILRAGVPHIFGAGWWRIW